MPNGGARDPSLAHKVTYLRGLFKDPSWKHSGQSAVKGPCQMSRQRRATLLVTIQLRTYAHTYVHTYVCAYVRIIYIHVPTCNLYHLEACEYKSCYEAVMGYVCKLVVCCDNNG